jgi:hypothetical protein
MELEKLYAKHFTPSTPDSIKKQNQDLSQTAPLLPKMSKDAFKYQCALSAV